MLLRVVESSRTNLPDNECSLNLGCLCSFDWGKEELYYLASLVVHSCM